VRSWEAGPEGGVTAGILCLRDVRGLDWGVVQFWGIALAGTGVTTVDGRVWIGQEVGPSTRSLLGIPDSIVVSGLLKEDWSSEIRASAEESWEVKSAT
jgi:hypothetical protein